MAKRREELERLQALSDEELRDEAARIKEALFRLNFKLALGEMDAINAARREKKTLARVQTLMRERNPVERGRGRSRKVDSQ